MKVHKLRYSIDIKADKAIIWKVLWESYREWAEVFFEGSYAVTDNWKEGSTVLFLSPDKSGIYSTVEKHIPNSSMMFKHIGNVVDGKEQPIDEEARKWTGATEVYKIIEKQDYNTLTIEIDVMDEHLDFMKDKLPEALQRIKELTITQHN